MVPCPGRVATIRKDTGAVLGVGLTDRFQPYQNGEAFAFGDHLIYEGGASCESGGSLFGGRQVFLSMELPDHIQVAGDPSDYRLFLLITNGHDGSALLRVSVTVERAICRNTIRIAHARAVSTWAIRHTKGLQGRVQEARNALGLTQKYAEAFTASASALVGMTLAERQVEDILATLFPLTEVQQARVDEGKDPGAAAALPVVRQVYYESPTVAPVRGTAYGVLSAVTEYVDHVKTYQKVAQGGSDENRAAHVIFDEGQEDPKQRAWDLLTSALS
jgi:phage/plasmid-like protein (TIGR03299 family)